MKFGRYELLRKIGAGGMGEVYLAEITGVEGFTKRLAVKRIFGHLNDDEVYRMLFIREAKLVARLSHPNIVQVYELGEVDGELFIAMEFIAGTDLASIMERVSAAGGQLPPGAVGALAFDILDALDYAHTLDGCDGSGVGIIHQDVSPRNILISDSGFAKLCDFGVARLTQSTTAGFRGKLTYASPEQISGGRIDGRSDLYALGVVLFEMLSQEKLFGGLTVEEIMHGGRQGRVVPVAQVAPRLSPALAHCIDRALREDPDDRYPSAASFREAVEDFLLSVGAGSARSQLRQLAREAATTASEPRDRARPTKKASGEDLVDLCVDEHVDFSASVAWRTLMSSADEHPAGVRRPTSDMRPTIRSTQIDLWTPSTALQNRPDVPFAEPISTGAGLWGAHDTVETPVDWIDHESQPALPPVRLAGVHKWKSIQISAAIFVVVAGVTAAALIGDDESQSKELPAVARSESGTELSRDESGRKEPVAVPEASLASTAPSVKLNAPRRRTSGAPAKSTNARPRNPGERRHQPPSEPTSRPAPAPSRLPRSATPQRLSRQQEYGLLNLNAIPWAHVIVDGKPLAKPTPLVGYRLPTGRHRVRLEGANGAVRELTVHIKPDETVTRILELK